MFENKLVSRSYLKNNDGFWRVAALCTEIKIGDPEGNAERILNKAKEAENEGAEAIVFPELNVTGYTCGDLFNQDLLIQRTEEAISGIREKSTDLNSILIIGAPIRYKTALFNCALVIYKGRIEGIVPKTFIPNYSEFYEKRWFSRGKPFEDNYIEYADQKDIPFGTHQIFKTNSGLRFGIEICEDLWVPNPPSTGLSMAGADVIFNLSATDEILGKHNYLLNLIKQQSARCRCGYVYASAGCGESSTDLVLSGNCIIAEDGNILKEGERFSRNGTYTIADIDIERLRHDRLLYNSFAEDALSEENYTTTIIKDSPHFIKEGQKLLRTVEAHPFVPKDKEHLEYNCREIISIQSWGLEQRLESTGCRHLIIGISGGLDSTLALLVACHAFDRLNLPRKNIIGVTMPGLATTDRTKSNAVALMEELDVTCLEIPIGKAVEQHFQDIDHDPGNHNATYENTQARERTQILMDLSNKYGGMVLGTGDLSELALGWCTYNGDHMSMYGVNASVPKTLVRHLVNWFAEYKSEEKTRRILKDIIETPISPELVPGNNDEIAQKTEDLIGPYELHDFFLYHLIRYGSRPSKIYRLAKIAYKDIYDAEFIKKWLISFYKRFFSQQFKRSCMPDGPKTGSVSLSPRGDWRMPSDASASLWLKEAESLSD